MITRAHPSTTVYRHWRALVAPLLGDGLLVGVAVGVTMALGQPVIGMVAALVVLLMAVYHLHAWRVFRIEITDRWITVYTLRGWIVQPEVYSRLAIGSVCLRRSISDVICDSCCLVLVLTNGTQRFDALCPYARLMVALS